MTKPDLHRVDGSALRFCRVGDIEHPRSLVVCLHGYGADGANLVPLAEALAPALDAALFVMPNAPQPVSDVMPYDQWAAVMRERPGTDPETMRTWVGRGADEGGEREAVLKALHDLLRPPIRAVNRLIDLLLARYTLADEALALFGFSQGGFLALNAAIARERPCAGVVSHSGHFIPGPEVRSRPPALVMVGSQELDPKMAMSAIHPVTIDTLRRLGLTVEEHVCEGLGHAVSDESVDRTAQFLRSALGQEPRTY